MQFSQGEIQQLQMILQGEINVLTDCKRTFKDMAKVSSQLGNKEVANEDYKHVEWYRQKINKLAELQRKLKRTKGHLIERSDMVIWSDEL